MAIPQIPIRDYLKQNLGHCPACIRQAMLAAAAAWGVFACAVLAGSGGLLLAVVGPAAAALTLLWLVHIIAFASRALHTETSGSHDGEGRRQVLGLMLKATAAAVAVSVPVALYPSAARAFCGQCTKNSDCGVGWKCANTAGPNQPVCMECVQA